MRAVVAKQKLAEAATREALQLKAQNYESHVGRLERDLQDARGRGVTAGFVGGGGALDGGPTAAAVLGGTGSPGGGGSSRAEQLAAIQRRLEQLEPSGSATPARNV
jgi:hypothetical protein